MIVDFDVLQKKMTSGMPDMQVTKFHVFKHFLYQILEFKDFKERIESGCLLDMDFNYVKESDVVTMSITMVESDDELRLDFANGRNSRQNEVKGIVCRRDQYVINMMFGLDQLTSIINKAKNLNKSNDGIEKFKL